MRDRFSACSIVSAATNCSPSIRIAISTPRRITGSPYRAIRRVRAADNPRSLTVDVSRPVITRPQVAALTNRDRPVPAWEIQSPPAILSRIRASRVAASGMRRSASARHINATPSWLDRAYSCSSASTIDPRCLRRRDSISPRGPGDMRTKRFGQRGLLEQGTEAVRFGAAEGRRDGAPERRLLMDRRGECGEGLGIHGFLGGPSEPCRRLRRNYPIRCGAQGRNLPCRPNH